MERQIKAGEVQKRIDYSDWSGNAETEVLGTMLLYSWILLEGYSGERFNFNVSTKKGTSDILTPFLYKTEHPCQFTFHV